MRGYLFAYTLLTRENAPRTREKHFFGVSMRILRLITILAAPIPSRAGFTDATKKTNRPVPTKLGIKYAVICRIFFYEPLKYSIKLALNTLICYNRKTISNTGGKKMSKKKNSTGKITALVSAVLGLAALAMIFLQAVGIKESETTYTGLQITFGYKETLPVIGDITVFQFSFMNLLTYLLALAGIVFSVLSAMGKGSKFAAFIAAAAFAVAGVFFFLPVSYCVPNADASKITSFLGGDIKEALTLAYGAIIGGVACLLAAIGNLGKLFFK